MKKPILMRRKTYPFQIKDPVTGVRFGARFIAPDVEIEGRVAAWEIIPVNTFDDSPARQAA
ncbi:MAG: hypothetical protein ABI624_17940 [Casimicrobiaceae bacterium]